MFLLGIELGLCCSRVLCLNIPESQGLGYTRFGVGALSLNSDLLRESIVWHLAKV